MYKIVVTGKYEYFDLDFKDELITDKKPKDNYLEIALNFYTKKVPLLRRLIKKSIKINIEEFEEEIILDYCI